MVLGGYSGSSHVAEQVPFLRKRPAARHIGKGDRMPYENIRTEKDGPAFVITLDRPARRNAVSLATMGEMIAAADEAAADPAVRGVVVTGGADYFSAGADLNDALPIQGAADGLAFFRPWQIGRASGRERVG